MRRLALHRVISRQVIECGLQVVRDSRVRFEKLLLALFIKKPFLLHFMFAQPGDYLIDFVTDTLKVRILRVKLFPAGNFRRRETRLHDSGEIAVHRVTALTDHRVILPQEHHGAHSGVLCDEVPGLPPEFTHEPAGFLNLPFSEMERGLGVGERVFRQ